MAVTISEKDTAKDRQHFLGVAPHVLQQGAWIFALLSIALLRLHTQQNSDVSIGVMMAERWLAGERFGIDFLEINPPGFPALYVPAVLFARITGLSAEFGVEVTITALALAVFVLAGRILARAGGVAPSEHQPLLLLGLVVALLVPGRAYAQREVFGVLLMVPWLALIANRIYGAAPETRSLRAVVGGLLGLALVAKPQFAVNIALVGAAALWSTRQLKTFWDIDTLAAAGLTSAYVIAVVLFCPAYFTEAIPLFRAYYYGFTSYVFLHPGPILLVATLLGIGLGLPLAIAAWGMAWSVDRHFAHLLAVSALGGVATYVMQRRGFAYHGLPAVLPVALAALYLAVRLIREPMRLAVAAGFTLAFAIGAAQATAIVALIALLLLVLLPLLVRGEATSLRPLIAVALLLPSLLFARAFFEVAKPIDRAGIAAAIAEVSPKPVFGVIELDTQYAFPLLRQVNGRFHQRDASTWAPYGIKRLLALKPSAEREQELLAADVMFRGRLRDDFVANPPDVILVLVDQEENWLAWARLDAAFANFLDGYVPYRRFGEVQLLTRRNVQAVPVVGAR